MTALFRPAEVTSAYLKFGLLGFQGSGKTKTATKVAIGLIEHMKKLGVPGSDRPAYFLDTEKGSDWVIPDFKAAGLPLLTAKTRAFSDLVEAVKLAERDGALLIVDSVTHFWRELCESYAKKRAQQLRKPNYFLQLKDWAYLKGPEGWGKFSDLFVNSAAHIILAGRAAYEFDMSEDEDGTKQLEKTGIKMRAETEFGYEPDLLVYMERHQKLAGDKIERVWREGTVMKDRAAAIDGQSFENPGFTDFLPHIERLNLGGRQLGVDTSRSSEHNISVEKKDWGSVQRKIVIDEIETLMALHYPSTSAKDKTEKLKMLLKHFNACWTEIEEAMPLADIRAGYDSLYRELEGKSSRYASTVEKVEINDELPEHSAPKPDGAMTTDEYGFVHA